VPVAPSLSELEALGLTPVGFPLISEEELLRHDPMRLAGAVLHLMGTLTGRVMRDNRLVLTR
jgi:hypothetical protein